MARINIPIIHREPQPDPNFDKRFFIREMERLDFLDGEELGVIFNERYWEERERIRMLATSPSKQVKIIRDGS